MNFDSNKEKNSKNLMDDLAMMRADLDHYPDIVSKDEYYQYHLMGRNSLPVGNNKLEDLKNLFETFQTNLKDAIDHDENETKDVELVLDLLSYTRTKDSETKPLYKAQEEHIDTLLKMTQMFAHDVQKPFNLIQTIMQKLETCENMDQINSIRSAYSSSVENSLTTVTGMIQDILDMGSKLNLQKESCTFSSLLNIVLRETFRFNSNSQIEFHYTFNHNFELYIDKIKIHRTLSNIILNACQALNWHGKIWFQTEDLTVEGKNFIKICIGNNSFIPQSQLPHLFEAFYTYNKHEGIGLGLAIAKKMVVAHGGEIWCNSDENSGVEFYLTLPIADSSDLIKFNLPSNSIELIDGI